MSRFHSGQLKARLEPWTLPVASAAGTPRPSGATRRSETPTPARSWLKLGRGSRRKHAPRWQRELKSCAHAANLQYWQGAARPLSSSPGPALASGSRQCAAAGPGFRFCGSRRVCQWARSLCQWQAGTGSQPEVRLGLNVSTVTPVGHRHRALTVITQWQPGPRATGSRRPVRTTVAHCPV